MVNGEWQMDFYKDSLKITYLIKNESIKKVIMEHNLRKTWDNIGKKMYI